MATALALTVKIPCITRVMMMAVKTMFCLKDFQLAISLMAANKSLTVIILPVRLEWIYVVIQ